MSLFDWALGRENLEQLSPEQQDQARSQAARQFIIGTLLGGRGLASGYEATQQVIPGIQAAQQRQRIGQAIQRSMVPVGTGLTQTQPGSQAGLLAQQNAEFGEDPLVQQRTVDALQRNPNVPRQLDPSRYLQNVLPLVATDPSKALPVIEAVRPRIDSTLGIQTDASGRVTGTFEREGKTPGTGVRLGAGGELTTRALPNAAMAAAEARPPEFPQGTVVGGVQIQDFPVYENGVLIGYTRRQVPMATEVPGVSGIIQGRQIREAQAETFGQESQFYDPSEGRMRTRSRAEQLGYTGGLRGAGSQDGQGGGMGASGVPTGPTPSEEALQRTRGTIFETRVKGIAEKATDAGRRAFQANQLYDTVSEIDPTALTALGATVVPYIRAIPGFRDVTDNFATNTALLGQQYARGVLGNFANVKGNLNAQEVRLVEDANWQKWDPRTATRYVAALEAAFADKDAAQLEFANRFMEDPQANISQFDQAWRDSENNISVFNHPMMIRFVTDEVREAVARGVTPNLPPGFKAEESRSTGRIRVTKPDGTTTFID